MFKDKRTKTEINFAKVVHELRKAILDAYYSNPYHLTYEKHVFKITRKSLRFLIGKACGISYRQGVYAVIEQLQVHRVISPNPSFEEHLFESDYSKYIIHLSEIFPEIEYDEDTFNLEINPHLDQVKQVLENQSVREIDHHSNQMLLSEFVRSSRDFQEADSRKTPS